MGAPFVLGSIFFDAVAAGTSAIDFGAIILSDEIGFPLQINQISSGVVTVNPPVAIAEPPVWALLIMGLSLLLWRRRSML